MKATHFLTVLWGKAFIGNFLDLVLPAHLAPGNLPAFADVPGAVYKIYTTGEDASVLRADPRVVEANRQVRVEIIEFAPTAAGLKFASSMEQFSLGASAAHTLGAAVVFLPPDVVLADGAFAALRRLHADGKRLIMLATPRARLATLPDALHQAVPPDPRGALAVPPRLLMEIGLEHLHPISDALFWDNPRFSAHPSHIYWWVRRKPPRAVLAHCFHLHPLFVDPVNKEVNMSDSADGEYIHEVCPDPHTHHIVTDSDEMAGVELSRESHMTGLDLLAPASIERVYDWSQWWCNPTHLQFFRHPILLHSGPPPAGAEIPAAPQRIVETLSAKIASLQRKLQRPRWQGGFLSWQGWFTEHFWSYCQPSWRHETGFTFPLSACWPSDLVVIHGRLGSGGPVTLTAQWNGHAVGEKRVHQGEFRWVLPAALAYYPELQITSAPPVAKSVLFIGSIRIWRSAWHHLRHEYLPGRADPVWLEWEGLPPSREINGPCTVRVAPFPGLVSLQIKVQPMEEPNPSAGIRTVTLPLDPAHPDRPLTVHLPGPHRLLAATCRETFSRRAQKEVAQTLHLLIDSIFTSAGRQHLARAVGWAR